MNRHQFIIEVMETIIELQIEDCYNRFNSDDIEPQSYQNLYDFIVPIARKAEFLGIDDGTAVCIDLLGYGDGLWGKPFDQECIEEMQEYLSDLRMYHTISLFVSEDNKLMLEFPL